MEEYFFDLFILVISARYFFKENDILKKQLALYLLSFVVFVVFSQLLFGKEYSGKHNIFYSDLNQVKYVIYLFMLVFFAFTRNQNKIPVYKVKSLKKIDGFDFIVASPIFIFFVYYSLTKGVRLSGEFVDHAGERSVWVDYMYVYTICCLVSLRGSVVVIGVALLLASAHLLAAERMRAFVYIISFLMIHYQLHLKKNQASLILLAGFVFATLLGIVRHGDAIRNDAYNVTHFGSVTISSLFLLDEAKNFTLIQQVKFFFGSIFANIIPSSLLSLDFNIRGFLGSKQDIPGGGWLPVWAYVIGGYVGVFCLAAVTAFFYRWALYSKSGYVLTRHQLAKYSVFIILTATAPRWFMYTPYQLFKMPFYGYVGTFLMVSFIEAFSKRKNFG